MPKITGTRFVADALRAYGVTHVFFVPQMLLETLTGMEGMGIRRIMTHGEKSAAYMADGFARASGRPGVCMAQHVGGSNLAAGLKDAYLACSPVIALAEKLSIPVATSLNAKGAILDTHALSVGVVGTYSRTCANRAVGEADLVFFIGSHTGGQVTARWQVPRAGTRVIHLDIDARELGRNYPTQLALLGDARTALRQMLDVAGSGESGTRSQWASNARCPTRPSYASPATAVSITTSGNSRRQHAMASTWWWWRITTVR